MLYAEPDAAVELYFDNSKKAETASWGLNVLGNCGVGDSSKFQCGDSQDLLIYHNGSSDSLIHETNHHLTIKTTTADKNLYLQSDDQVKIGTATGEEQHIVATKNGSTELYCDNSKKLETTSSGITVTGTVTDSTGELRTIVQNLSLIHI